MKNILYCAIAGMLSSTASVAYAQDADTQSTAATDGTDIVVTALRRSERLQNVPASVTAVSGDVLQEQRITSADALGAIAPNLQATTSQAAGVPVFTIRGITITDMSSNQQGPIVTYFDEGFKGTYTLFPVGLYDLERVEVLRGPQGTVYGKNTTGGAINFISKTPGFDTEGYLMAGYGNYDRFEANGAVQTALSENLAARIAFSYIRDGGTFENLFPGQPDMSQTKEYGIRGTLLFKPTDTLSFILRAATSLRTPVNIASYITPTDAGGVTGGVLGEYTRAGLKRRQIEEDYAPRIHHRVNSVALTGSWEASDDLAVTSITTYDYGNISLPAGSDGSPLKVNDSTKDYGSKERQFTQDLRLTSSFDTAFNFIIGAYYFNDNLRGSSVYDVLTTRIASRFKQHKEAGAVYSDLTYKLTDRLAARAGLRYTRETGNVSDYFGGLYNLDGSPIFEGLIDGSASFKTNNVSGKVGLDFQVTPDQLLYASYSRGFRGRGFTSLALFDPIEIQPSKVETLDSYEIGLKSQWFDRKLTVNGSIFYYNYKNQQASDILEGGIGVQYSIPKSRLMGGELEVTVRPVRSLTINGSLGVTDTKILAGVLSAGTPGEVQLRGKRLPKTAKVSAAAGIAWDVVDSEQGKVALGVDASYNSKRYFDLPNTERTAQGKFVLFNAQIRLRTADDRYGLTFWGRNLTNKFYFSQNYDASSFGYDFGVLGDPRTYGFSLDAKF